MVRAFWTAPHGWPADPAGYVFLARAFELVGRSRFPGEWTGKEVVTRPPRAERKAPAVLPTLYPRRSGSPETIEPAEKVSRIEAKRRKDALIRHGVVVRIMIKQAEFGELEFAHRSIAGGAMQPCPREWWNTERAWVRFTMYRIIPSNPYSGSAAGDGDAWLFVTRKSLEKVLKRASTISGPARSDDEPARRGRRPAFPWDACKKEAMRKLEDDGAPTSESGDPEWRSQADFERWISQWMLDRLGTGQVQPASSTVRQHARKWLGEFQRSRKGSKSGH